MNHRKEHPTPTDEQAMRAAYARTALARGGIPFERAIESRAVREFLELAAGVGSRDRKAACSLGTQLKTTPKTGDATT